MIVILCCVGAVSIAIGVVGTVQGVPAGHGLSSAEALALLDDRPVLWTVGWAVWSVVWTALAIYRALWVTRHRPQVRFTAIRGSLWLWGAVGAPWFYPWIAWDFQIFDYYNESPPVGAPSPALSIAMYWWFGAGLALVAGVVWSTAISIRPNRETADQARIALPS